MSTTAVNRSRSTKRRTKADMEVIRQAVYQVVELYQPMTVRQVFYQLVVRWAIDKAESEYKGTVVRLLSDMRRSRQLPFDWIADNTRWMRKPTTFSSLEMALRRTAEVYRRSVWDNQGVYVEIWLEKDALAGVLYDVTSEWDVPLMVTRGYPSLTYLNAAADAIAASGKPAYLYYFGDHDPSGVDITRATEAGLREFAPTAEIHFERVAVTPDQITDWQLPTRPTKLTDTRSRNFLGESVEVDAIPPDVLRTLARDCIVKHLSDQSLAAMYAAEDSERELLTRMVNALYNGHQTNGVPSPVSDGQE